MVRESYFLPYHFWIHNAWPVSDFFSSLQVIPNECIVMNYFTRLPHFTNSHVNLRLLFTYCGLWTTNVLFNSRRSSLTTTMAVAGVGFFLPPFVCLLFRTISRNLMQLGSPNLTQECSKISHGNPFILGVKRSKVTVESQKHCRRGSLHSCECWLFLVIIQSLLVVRVRWDWLRNNVQWLVKSVTRVEYIALWTSDICMNGQRSCYIEHLQTWRMHLVNSHWSLRSLEVSN